MSPQPDEKRTAITGILDLLRPYASGLGSCEKSVYTHDFDYSIKLSNGRIRLPEELIDDYERAAHSTKTLDAPNSDRGTKVSINRESLTCNALQLN